MNEDKFNELTLALGDICRDIDELEDALSKGWVNILFLKKDGSVRLARGTRDLTKIPTEMHPRNKRPTPSIVLTFYDMFALGWRCLLRDRLIGFLKN